MDPALGKGFEDMAPVEAAARAMAGGNASDKVDRPASPRIEPSDPSAWSRVIPLAFPLVVDGQRLDAITCKRLTGRQLMDLIMQVGESDEAALREAAYAMISGVHPSVLSALEAGDLDRVMDAIRPFLPPVLRDDLDAAVMVGEGATVGAG
jgi:hypothetical protein